MLGHVKLTPWSDAHLEVGGAGPVPGAKEGGGHGEHLIVDEAGVDGEDGHQQQTVPPCAPPNPSMLVQTLHGNGPAISL